MAVVAFGITNISEFVLFNRKNHLLKSGSFISTPLYNYNLINQHQSSGQEEVEVGQIEMIRQASTNATHGKLKDDS